MATPTTSQDKHLDRLALASIAMAVLVAAGGLFAVAYYGARGLVGQLSGDFSDDRGFYVAAAVLVATALITGLAVATAIGLRKRRAWSRRTGFATGALTVLSFPFGTAYGAYAFWVLTRPWARRTLAGSVN